MDPLVFVPLAVAIIGPLFAYIRLSRRMSGKISTTEASRLWEASEKMRNDLGGQVAIERERRMELEGRVQNLERVNTEIVAENYELKSKVAHCEGLLERLRETIRTYEATIHTQREELERGR